MMGYNGCAYIYIYIIYMYVCMYVYVYVNVYVYVYIYICIYICVYIYREREFYDKNDGDITRYNGINSIEFCKYNIVMAIWGRFS